MLKHTEDWEISQPPNLKHLTIVRDSASIGRSQHILFLTIENFENLVQQGLTSWEAIKSKPNGKKKSKDAQKTAGKMHLAHSLGSVDQYGFADIQMSVLGGKDGQGTLSENDSLAVMEFLSATVNDPMPYQENGEWSKSPSSHVRTALISRQKFDTQPCMEIQRLQTKLCLLQDQSEIPIILQSQGDDPESMPKEKNYTDQR
jgi:hypothetical protein